MNNQEQEAEEYQCKRASIDKNRSFKTKNSHHHSSKPSNPTKKTKKHLPHSSHLIDNPPQATPSSCPSHRNNSSPSISINKPVNMRPNMSQIVGLLSDTFTKILILRNCCLRVTRKRKSWKKRKSVRRKSTLIRLHSMRISWII